MNHHADNISEQITDYKNSIDDDTIKQKDDTINDTINAGASMSVKERAVFAAIIENNSITIDGIIEKTGFSRPTVNRAISTLKKNGYMEREGSRKTGNWIILKKEALQE